MCILYFPTSEISTGILDSMDKPGQCLQSLLNSALDMLLHSTTWVLCLLPRENGKRPNIVSTELYRLTPY